MQPFVLPLSGNRDDTMDSTTLGQSIRYSPCGMAEEAGYLENDYYIIGSSADILSGYQ
jgi:hypothetical protein